MSSIEEQVDVRVGGARAVPISVGSIDPAIVSRQLKAILSSKEFFRSERLSTFLTEIVRATLALENASLTERNLGKTVFGKETGWDPREDTIVRSEARRLRRKLREFYEENGSDSAVLINLPLGSYVVSFALLEDQEKQDPVQPSMPPLEEALLVPIRSAEKSRRALIVFSGLILVTAALSIWAPSSRTKAASADFTIMPFANEIGEEYSPAVSPDDQIIAYVWDGNIGEPNIYLRNTDTSHRKRLTTGVGSYFSPAWSSDGKQLSYLRLQGKQLDLMIRDLQSGKERLVSSVRRETGRWSSASGPLLGNIGPEWSSDGSSLYVADRQFSDGGVGGVYKIDIATGSRTEITFASGEQRDFSPRISPDGRTLAFVRYFSHGHGELFSVPITGGTPTQLTNDLRDIQGITWNRDGKSIVFCSNRGSYFQLWSISTKGGLPTLLPTNTTSATDPFMFHHSTRLGFVDMRENWNIWRYSVQRGLLDSKKLLISSSGRNHDPRFSPDGRHIAFISDRSGSLEIWITEPDGSQPKQLTHVNGSWINSISWSNDGKAIAFDARPSGHAAIYSIPLGGGDMTLIDDAGVEQRMPSWAANGVAIYFNSVRDGAVAIYRKELRSETTVRVSEHEMYTVAQSPDGQKLFYSDRSGNLFQADPDGSNSRPLNLAAFPVKSWAPTQRGLVYSRKGASDGTFQICLFEGGRTIPLGVPDNPLVTNGPDVSLSPDGKWLLVAQQDQILSDIKLRVP